MKALTPTLCLAAVTLTASTSAWAAVVSESWDYTGTANGTQVTAANDFDGGSGWSGAEWVQLASNANSVGYSSVGNLAYTATGYQNTNAAGSGGAFGIATQGNSNKGVFRAVAAAPLTGTVYASMLFANNKLTGVQTSLFFRDTDAGGQGLGFRAEADANAAGLAWGAGDGGNLYNDSNEQGTQYAFNEGDGDDYASVNLVILKFETDYAGTFDRVTMYLNPTDVTTEAQALATSSTSVVDGADIWGADLNADLALHTRVDGAVDQIGVAYGDDGFAELVSVPEPASLALLAAGGLLCLPRRRR
jgi:hypothetical protein